MPVEMVERLEARASVPRIRVMEWIRDLVVCEGVVWERRLERWARRAGCVEGWTFGGRGGIVWV